MFLFNQEADLVQDREDLLHVLRMRFGEIAPGIVEKVYEMNDLDTLERLILVAANAPTLKVFIEEMESDDDSFKIVGERFNPMSSMFGGGNVDGEEKQ